MYCKSKMENDAEKNQCDYGKWCEMFVYFNSKKHQHLEHSSFGRIFPGSSWVKYCCRKCFFPIKIFMVK